MVVSGHGMPQGARDGCGVAVPQQYGRAVVRQGLGLPGPAVLMLRPPSDAISRARQGTRSERRAWRAAALKYA